MIDVVRLRSFVAILGLGLAAAFQMTSAQAADEFPTRAVTIVVPYTAGGPYDTFIRALGTELTERWKQPVVVINRPGAAESIGATSVIKSPPDGYTLLAASELGLTIGPHLYKTPYDVQRDLAPITRMMGIPLVLLVPKDFPANTLQEIVALARKADQKPLTYGSPGVGSQSHIPLVQLQGDAKIKLTHIPYKGGADMLLALNAGQIDMALSTLSVAQPFISSGKLRAIATTGTERSRLFPAIPTVAESDFKGMSTVASLSLLAPKATPRAVVQSISQSVSAVLQKAEFAAKNVTSFGGEILAAGPDELADYIARDTKTQGDLIRANNIKVE